MISVFISLLIALCLVTSVAQNMAGSSLSFKTVPTLNLNTFLGRWLVMYASKIPLESTLQNSFCVSEKISLNEVRKNTVSLSLDFTYNLNSPTGQLRKFSGVAANYDFLAVPGKWALDLTVESAKMDMGGITTDFWILDVGSAIDTSVSHNPVNPASTIDPITGVYHGPMVLPDPKRPTDDAQYQWVILSDSAGSQLFILARDAVDFNLHYEREVLQKVKDLGFTSEATKPIKVVQSAQCRYPKD